LSKSTPHCNLWQMILSVLPRGVHQQNEDPICPYSQSFAWYWFEEVAALQSSCRWVQ
jgi:hypothetical protein